MAKRIAVLTGGGHISSFHAGMYGICRQAEEVGWEVIGFRDGYRGTVEDSWVELTAEMLEPNKAGSLLGSTRERADLEAVKRAMHKHQLAALIVMGGNDHLGEAARLAEAGLPVIGWPKTMDNDLSVTYFTFGFPTAAVFGARMVRQAHYDAITNSRLHLITLFGRSTDWIACACGVWGSADIIVPAEKYCQGVDETRYEVRFIFERAEEALTRNEERFGRRFAVMVVAEGADIGGLAAHLDPEDFDVHGNPKIEPMKLALALKAAFRDLGGRKYPIAIDCFSYALRNCPPVEVDRRLAEEAGRLCVRAAVEGRMGSAVVVRRPDLSLDLAPLAEVAEQRFMRPEKLFDYEAMEVLPAFADYYQPLFGPPPTKEDFIYRALR